MRRAFTHCIAGAFTLVATFIPSSSDFGLTGTYYYFGFPVTALTIKHGTMGNPNVKNGWFVIPDAGGILMNATCWFLVFVLIYDQSAKGSRKFHPSPKLCGGIRSPPVSRIHAPSVK